MIPCIILDFSLQHCRACLKKNSCNHLLIFQMQEKELSVIIYFYFVYELLVSCIYHCIIVLTWPL